MEPAAYLRAYADQIGQELFGVARIKPFAANTDILGAYAEACVRRLVRRTVYPLQVSRGSVIHPGNYANLRQLDAIIWQPTPIPAIFEVDDFALVPTGSAFGWLEIKSSCYSKGARTMAEQLALKDLVAPLDANEDSLGVFCVRLLGQNSPAVRQLLDEGRAVVILNQTAREKFAPDPLAICELINFLYRVRWRAMIAQQPRHRLNTDLLRDQDT